MGIFSKSLIVSAIVLFFGQVINRSRTAMRDASGGFEFQPDQLSWIVEAYGLPVLVALVFLSVVYLLTRRLPLLRILLLAGLAGVIVINIVWLDKFPWANLEPIVGPILSSLGYNYKPYLWATLLLIIVWGGFGLFLRRGLMGKVLAMIYAVTVSVTPYLVFDHPARLVDDWMYPKAYMLSGIGMSVAKLSTRVRNREGRRVAVFEQEYFYCYDKTAEVIRVPPGFETDFASIPYGLWWFINPEGDTNNAAVVHDWLYAVGGEPTDQLRLKADDIFLAAMTDSYVNEFKRRVMYRAVRVGGGKAYGGADEARFYDPNNPTVKLNPPPAMPSSAIVAKVTSCQALRQCTPSLNPEDCPHLTGDGPPPGGNGLRRLEVQPQRIEVHPRVLPRHD